MQLDVGRFLINMLPIFVVPVLLSVITSICSQYIDFNNLFVLFTGIIIFTTVYGILNYFIIFNSYEKELINKPILKILKILRIKRGSET